MPQMPPDHPTRNGTVIHANGTNGTSSTSLTNGTAKMSNGTSLSPRSAHHIEMMDKPPGTRCCCGRVHLQKGSGIIGGLSLVSVLLNALLVLMGVGRLGLNPYFEVSVLFVDFFTVICLLRGIHKRKSALLRPFLVFNFLWNGSLVILFIWCMVRMARGTDLARPFLQQIGREPRPTQMVLPFGGFGPPEEKPGLPLLGLLLLSFLALLIFIGCFFVHVVYRTFRMFAYDEEKEAIRRPFAL